MKSKEERFAEAVSEVNRRWGFYAGQDDGEQASEAKPKREREDDDEAEELLSEVASKRYSRRARLLPDVMPWEEAKVAEAIAARVRAVNRKWHIGR
jgi:hypothetical protein